MKVLVDVHLFGEKNGELELGFGGAFLPSYHCSSWHRDQTSKKLKFLALLDPTLYRVTHMYWYAFFWLSLSFDVLNFQFFAMTVQFYGC